MGIFKKIGDGLKKTKEAISEEIKRQKETNEKKRRKKQGYLKIKGELLKTMSFNDMKKIYKQYGITEPSMFTNDLSGNKIKKTGNPRYIYLRHIKKNIALEILIEFVRKRKNISNLLKEKKKIDEI